MAGPASGSIFTNHCSETSGSITLFERSEIGTLCSSFSVFSSSPRSSNPSSTALRAASRDMPAKGPPTSLSVPSFSSAIRIGSLCRCPRS